MLNRILSLVFSLLATLSTSTNASDEVIDQLKKEFQLVEANYSAGYCRDAMEDPVLTPPIRRYFSLLVMQDINLYALGATSGTGTLIGSLTSYKIGRKINNTFINFIEYASRPDIQKIIDADAAEFSNAATKEKEMHKEDFDLWQRKIKDIKNSARLPVATRTKDDAEKETLKLLKSPMICRIYEIIMLPQSEAALEFQEYASSVNRRALNNNMENFRQMMEDY